MPADLDTGGQVDAVSVWLSARDQQSHDIIGVFMKVVHPKNICDQDVRVGVAPLFATRVHINESPIQDTGIGAVEQPCKQSQRNRTREVCMSNSRRNIDSVGLLSCIDINPILGRQVQQSVRQRGIHMHRHVQQ